MVNTLADQDTHRGGPDVTEPARQAPTWLAAVLLLLSGAASLIYQVAWVRLLGLSMGSTGASISTVLAAFFLGLAGGSALAGLAVRVRRWRAVLRWVPRRAVLRSR